MRADSRSSGHSGSAVAAARQARPIEQKTPVNINVYIEVSQDAERGAVMRCRCGLVLGPATGNYKRYSLEARYPVQHAGPHVNPYRLGGERFELREYYCPACLVLFETEVALVGDPVLHDVELAVGEEEGG